MTAVLPEPVHPDLSTAAAYIATVKCLQRLGVQVSYSEGLPMRFVALFDEPNSTVWLRPGEALDNKLWVVRDLYGALTDDEVEPSAVFLPSLVSSSVPSQRPPLVVVSPSWR